MNTKGCYGLALAILLSPSAEGWEAAAQPAVAEAVAAQTQMLKLDDVALRVRTAGLDRRRAGQAVVVFESGGGSALETWDTIFAEVAKLAPVLAYDRSGTGKSAWDSHPPTPERVTARLQRLLAALKVNPPYVLVGHSWGGALIRYFAGAAPNDVVALAYLDPTDITQSPADEKAIFESIGAPASWPEPHRPLWPQICRSMRRSMPRRFINFACSACVRGCERQASSRLPSSRVTSFTGKNRNWSSMPSDGCCRCEGHRSLADPCYGNALNAG